MFGLRAEPYAALTGLSRELAGTMPSDDVAARIVDTVRRSLRMPYVAVAIGDESGFPIAAQSGIRTDQVLTLPLLHQGERAGLLIVGYDEHHPLRAPDRALLHDLAEHLGSAVRGVQLTAGLRQGAADLQVARERLVLTREEERRRLRRDLHDGLAPTLAAAGLTAATASDLRELDPEESRRLLDQLQRTLRAAVGDIRTLVDGLRPPALDELGLLPALRDRIGELQGVRTTFEAPEQLPALPAAVEVAAYRICQEALMNVARHAHGRSVIVRLSVDESLHLLVEDDGVGVRSSDAPGVGLASMRERALELGGACTIDEARPSGTPCAGPAPPASPGGRPMIRVLVADDHPLFREGLRTMIEATDDLTLSAEAGDGAEAVQLAGSTMVDVALLDLNMPGLNGVEAASRISLRQPEVAVLMLTMFEDDASVFAALRAGARGYVLKDSSRDELLRAIRAVASGEAIFSPSVASRVLDFFTRRHPSVAPDDFPMLTARERDVLHLIAQGRSNPQIASQLGLSRKTTSNYVSSILTKLQVRDRSEAAERAKSAVRPPREC